MYVYSAAQCINLQPMMPFGFSREELLLDDTNKLQKWKLIAWNT